MLELAMDLPAETLPPEEITAAVGAFYVALEIPDGSFAGKFDAVDMAADNAAAAAMYPTAVAYGYGEIWSRPDLDHRQRMICAVAAFTAIGHLPQVIKFGQSALNTGLTREQVVEIIMQTGPYSGFPRSLNALSAFGDTLG